MATSAKTITFLALAVAAIYTVPGAADVAVPDYQTAAAKWLPVDPDYMVAARSMLKGNVSAYAAELLSAVLTMYDDLKVQLEPVSATTTVNGAQQTLKIYPISFAITEEFVRHTVPDKRHGWGTVIPGNPATYVFRSHAAGCWEVPVDSPANTTQDLLSTRHMEARYHGDMAGAFFSISYRKAGWDCLRHLEILGMGSLLIMPGIESCPRTTMAFYPKKILNIAKRFPGQSHEGSGGLHGSNIKLSYDEAAVDRPLYAVTVTALLDYTRRVLSTRAMAAYILETAGVPKPRSVLYLATNESWYGDYQGDAVLHGLKLLLGGAAVTDYVRRDVIYRSLDDLDWKKHTLWKCHLLKGGYTFAALFMELPGTVDRSNIAARIKAKEFDVVVVGQAHRSETPFLDEVMQSYPRDKVIALYGGDGPILPRDVHKYAQYSSWIFSRETQEDGILG